MQHFFKRRQAATKLKIVHDHITTQIKEFVQLIFHSYFLSNVPYISSISRSLSPKPCLFNELHDATGRTGIYVVSIKLFINASSTLCFTNSSTQWWWSVWLGHVTIQQLRTWYLGKASQEYVAILISTQSSSDGNFYTWRMFLVGQNKPRALNGTEVKFSLK